jgi:hypothetical protein
MWVIKEKTKGGIISKRKRGRKCRLLKKRPKDE